MRLLREFVLVETLVIGFGLLLFGLTIWAEHNFVYPSISIGGESSRQVPPIEKTFALKPTDMQEFQDLHGPVLSTEAAANLRSLAGVRNMAILKDNGHVLYLAQTVPFSIGTNWTKTNPVELTALTVTGTSVEIRDQRGNHFVLNISQPFVFSGSLSRTYAVDAKGVIWSAEVSSIQFVPANFDDTKLPVNPNLSLSFGS